MKHEWRKKEKDVYFPKAIPEKIDVPDFQFLTISGEGNPNSEHFGDYIAALYSMSYAIKMSLKKNPSLQGHMDYTVYPLEGVWSLNEEAIKNFTGVINKDDFIFTLMIRQPDFVTADYVEEMRKLTMEKKPQDLLAEVEFQTIEEGTCVQMLHIGSYDNEPESFAKMEEFARKNGLVRESKVHREIYLSDFRKVPQEKLKTVLRFKVNS